MCGSHSDRGERRDLSICRTTWLTQIHKVEACDVDNRYVEVKVSQAPRCEARLST